MHKIKLCIFAVLIVISYYWFLSLLSYLYLSCYYNFVTVLIVIIKLLLISLSPSLFSALSLLLKLYRSTDSDKLLLISFSSLISCYCSCVANPHFPIFRMRARCKIISYSFYPITLVNKELSLSFSLSDPQSEHMGLFNKCSSLSPPHPSKNPHPQGDTSTHTQNKRIYLWIFLLTWRPVFTIHKMQGFFRSSVKIVGLF